MHQDNLEINGAIVFWKIAPRSDRRKIVEGLEELGLGKYAPRERTPYTVLCEAARAVTRSREYLIRPLEKNRGIAIVKERRGDVDSGNDYDSKATVLCPTNGHIEHMSGLDSEQRDLLDTYYSALKNALPAAAVGASLSKIAVEALSGTRSLRDSGGIYWIPKRVDRGLERGHFRGPKRATWRVAERDSISPFGRRAKEWGCGSCDRETWQLRGGASG